MAHTHQGINLLRAASALDRRSRRVVSLLILLVILCVGDLILTLIYWTQFGLLENNPLARGIMSYRSPALLVAWKLASVSLGVGILFWARKTRIGEAASWLCVGVMALLAVHWMNYTNEIHSLTEYLVTAADENPQWIAIDSN